MTAIAASTPRAWVARHGVAVALAVIVLIGILAAPGQARPSDFECPPGSGRTVSQWRKGGPTRS